MDKNGNKNYTNVNQSDLKENKSREVIEMGATTVPKENKILATPKSAKDLRELVSRKLAFGVKLVDQHKQGR